MWTAAKQGNYGVFWYKGKNVGAHRFAYELIQGEIPKDYVIDHLCNNPECVNPEHLEATTQQKNVLRSPINGAAINAKKTHCNRGHEFSKENTYLYKNMRHCKECKKLRLREWRAKKKEMVS
ncbi:hypothetical protein BBV17_03685 [Cytobacillus oceanisediminis]|uniref:HNH nuclease domain-containing protein n=1 Tax=Cytobacillus oceanisediminis TaxID=665099 RepID=A0ABX3CJE1_9BACI|nr:hypothetical protein BBV17_03685 [Cytobacillus oceanisediminis]